MLGNCPTYIVGRPSHPWVDCAKRAVGVTIVSEAPRTRPPHAPTGAAVPFWAQPADALLAHLGSSPGGLTSDEARRRQSELGPATIRRGMSSSRVRILVRQFGNPLVVLLTVAAVLSSIVGERTDSAVILVVVIAGGLLGFWQEHRAANAVAELLALVRTTTTVLRDAVPVAIPLEDVVPGDVVV